MLGETIYESILGLPGDLPQAVMDEFRRGWQAEAYFAQKQQEEIAATLGQAHTVDGLGQTKLRVTPEAFHYWGQRLGYACWRDKKFCHEFARDNPAARVRTVPRQSCVRINGFKS